MPTAPQRRSPWRFFTPWRWPTRIARLLGYYLLAYLAVSIACIVIPWHGLPWVVAGMSIGLLLFLTVEGLAVNRRLNRISRHQDTFEHALGKLIEGTWTLDDLPPEIQEELAMRRATRHIGHSGLDHE